MFPDGGTVSSGGPRGRGELGGPPLALRTSGALSAMSSVNPFHLFRAPGGLLPHLHLLLLLPGTPTGSPGSPAP